MATTAPIKISDVFPSSFQCVNSESARSANKIPNPTKATSPPPLGQTNVKYLSTASKVAADSIPPAPRPATARVRPPLTKTRLEHYDRVFALRESPNKPTNRVTEDSMVVVEIKLNCQLEVEHTFLSDISLRLSEIYRRPESCITVSVATVQTILFGGSLEPAYYMTITALASEISPNHNECSTFWLQDFLHESLKIAPARGILLFEPISEENLATNGKTTLQEINEMERSLYDHSQSFKANCRGRRQRSKSAYTPVFMGRGKIPTPHTTRSEKLGCQQRGGTKSSDVSGAEAKGTKGRKSIMAFFSR